MKPSVNYFWKSLIIKVETIGQLTLTKHLVMADPAQTFEELSVMADPAQTFGETETYQEEEPLEVMSKEIYESYGNIILDKMQGSDNAFRNMVLNVIRNTEKKKEISQDPYIVTYHLKEKDDFIPFEEHSNQSQLLIGFQGLALVTIMVKSPYVYENMHIPIQIQVGAHQLLRIPAGFKHAVTNMSSSIPTKIISFYN